MLGKITKTTVERLPPGEWLWDADHRQVVKGFGARRQTAGVFYYLRYRLDTKQRMGSIGHHGSPWTPDAGRTEAKRLLGMVAAGVDPFPPKEDKPPEVETFGTELKRYLENKKATMRPAAYLLIERHLTNHAKALHGSKLNGIDRRAIASMLSEIEAGRGPASRNRTRSSLSTFFNWAIAEGRLEFNPVTGTAKANEGRSRERVLSEAELKTIWAALKAGQFGDILKLLILTGQRRDEIGGLRWSEVNLERGLIVLPPARTKNKRLHEIPLSSLARAILERQTRRKARDLIFGRGDGQFSGFSDCKAQLERRLPKAIPDWRIHDLRRTAATMMAELGVLPHIIEAILNHVSGHKSGVAGIYNRARYATEMRDALAKLGAHIEAITRQ